MKRPVRLSHGKSSNSKKGFTLVELIVVIVILGILMAVSIANLVPFISKASATSVATTDHYVNMVDELNQIDSSVTETEWENFKEW